MRDFLLLVGLPGTRPTIQIIVRAGVIFGAALLLGWVADMIMSDEGFGISLNAAILLIGAVGAAIIWQKSGLSLPMHPHAARATVAGGGGVVALILCGLFRRLG